MIPQSLFLSWETYFVGQSPNLAEEGRKQTFLQLEDLSGRLIYKAAPQLLANLEAVKRRQQWRKVRAGDDTSEPHCWAPHNSHHLTAAAVPRGSHRGSSLCVCLHDLHLILICIQYEPFYKTNLSSLEEMGLITLLPWLQATSTSILILKIKQSIHRAAFMHDIINAARRSHFL